MALQTALTNEQYNPGRPNKIIKILAGENLKLANYFHTHETAEQFFKLQP